MNLGLFSLLSSALRYNLLEALELDIYFVIKGTIMLGSGADRYEEVLVFVPCS